MNQPFRMPAVTLGSWKCSAVGISTYYLMGHYYMLPLLYQPSRCVGVRLPLKLSLNWGWINTSSIGSRVPSSIYLQNTSMSCSTGFTAVTGCWLPELILCTKWQGAFQPCYIFLDCFLHVFSTKSWQLHLMLFMKLSCLSIKALRMESLVYCSLVG